MQFTKPEENRYVIFPGNAYHGVVGRMWRDKQPDALRMSMAVNWWTNKPTAEYLMPSTECMSAFDLDQTPRF